LALLVLFGILCEYQMMNAAITNVFQVHWVLCQYSCESQTLTTLL
jgi:hypothetical protein